MPINSLTRWNIIDTNAVNDWIVKGIRIPRLKIRNYATKQGWYDAILITQHYLLLYTECISCDQLFYYIFCCARTMTLCNKTFVQWFATHPVSHDFATRARLDVIIKRYEAFHEFLPRWGTIGVITARTFSPMINSGGVWTRNFTANLWTSLLCMVSQASKDFCVFHI